MNEYVIYGMYLLAGILVYATLHHVVSALQSQRLSLIHI